MDKRVNSNIKLIRLQRNANNNNKSSNNNKNKYA